MTNQFTDEQVEAAAKAYWLASEREIHDKPITWEWDKEERRRYMWAARQVLEGAGAVPVTAAATAPQSESEHEYLLKARALHQTNSGLPSSTVDEDALAEVIRRSYENEQGLKIRDDKRTARAVAEWLRGESR